MTQKYLQVRRAIYEADPAKCLDSKRSFADMVRLFKIQFWILLGLLFASWLTIAIMVFVDFRSPIILVAAVIMLVCACLVSIPREKHLYYGTAREQELSSWAQTCKEYTKAADALLHKCGIDTPEKRKCIREECTSALKAHNEKYAHLNSQIVQAMIGVPLGALVSSIIYAKNDVALASVFLLVMLAFLALMAVQGFKKLRYYSDGYVRDQYLLNILEELDYC